MKRFEQLSHTADIKIRAYGSTLQELFANALFGMFQSIGPHAPGCTKEGELLVCPELPETHDVTINGSPDLDSLLVDFLSEALYLSDVHDQAYFEADIHTLDENNLTATLRGVNVTGFEVVEIKAVTYHDLHIAKTGDTWSVSIVFDI